MAQAYPQGRPQEDPRVPLPRYVIPSPTLFMRACRSCSTLKSKYLNGLTDYWIEGVLVAKKDFNLPKHGDIDTKNLFVR